MKFQGTPGLLVRVNKNSAKNRRLKHFRFDENGVFEINDPRMIKALKKRFAVIEETKTMSKCKKCNFECENKGELMAHYKQAHPKK